MNNSGLIQNWLDSKEKISMAFRLDVYLPKKAALPKNLFLKEDGIIYFYFSNAFRWTNEFQLFVNEWFL